MMSSIPFYSIHTIIHSIDDVFGQTVLIRKLYCINQCCQRWIDHDHILNRSSLMDNNDEFDLVDKMTNVLFSEKLIEHYISYYDDFIEDEQCPNVFGSVKSLLNRSSWEKMISTMCFERLHGRSLTYDVSLFCYACKYGDHKVLIDCIQRIDRYDIKFINRKFRRLFSSYDSRSDIDECLIVSWTYDQDETYLKKTILYDHYHV